MKSTRIVLAGLGLLSVSAIAALVILALGGKGERARPGNPAIVAASPSVESQHAQGDPLPSAGPEPALKDPVVTAAHEREGQEFGGDLQDFVSNSGKPRVTPDFAVRVPSVQSPEAIAAVLRVVRDLQDRDTERHEAVNLLRRSHFAGIDDELRSILADARESARFRSFAAQHLGLSMSEPQADPRLREDMRALLDDRDLAVRREALLALVLIKDPGAIALVGSGLTDPHWGDARDLVIRCMHELGMIDRVAEVRPFAYDNDESVRISAIAVLGQWHDVESRSAFEEARQSSRARLQHAGELALATLNRPIPSGSPRVDGLR